MPKLRASGVNPDINNPSTAPKVGTVAKQLEALRVECDLTQQQLSDLVGIDIRTVQRNLSGESTPSRRRVKPYEQVFSKRLKRNVVIEHLP
jgi:DNA-binding XRE family transcriptional regulator